MTGTFLALGLLQGCIAGKFYHPGVVATGVMEKRTSKTYVLGAIVEPVDVGTVCGTMPVAAVEIRSSLANGLLAVITVGMYAPRTVRVYCGERGP